MAAAHQPPPRPSCHDGRESRGLLGVVQLGQTLHDALISPRCTGPCRVFAKQKEEPEGEPLTRRGPRQVNDKPSSQTRGCIVIERPTRLGGFVLGCELRPHPC